MIRVLYTKTENEIDSTLYNACLRQLPITLQQKNKSFVRWQDRANHLLGQMLLTLGMLELNQKNYWNSLQYNRYGRPFFNTGVDFNISHTDGYVVCALSPEYKVGVDIERIQQINLGDFATTMTDQQWAIIYNSNNSCRQFFNFWTIKESVVKADARGLSIPLIDIEIDNTLARLEDKVWYLKNIFFDPKFSSCLASDHVTDTEIREISPREWFELFL